MSCDVMQWEPDVSGLPVYSTSSMTVGLHLCKKCGSAGKVMVICFYTSHPLFSLLLLLPLLPPLSPLPHLFSFLPSLLILSLVSLLFSFSSPTSPPSSHLSYHITYIDTLPLSPPLSDGDVCGMLSKVPHVLC